MKYFSPFCVNIVINLMKNNLVSVHRNNSSKDFIQNFMNNNFHNLTKKKINFALTNVYLHNLIYFFKVDLFIL